MEADPEVEVCASSPDVAGCEFAPSQQARPPREWLTISPRMSRSSSANDSQFDCACAPLPASCVNGINLTPRPELPGGSRSAVNYINSRRTAFPRNLRETSQQRLIDRPMYFIAKKDANSSVILEVRTPYLTIYL